MVERKTKKKKRKDTGKLIEENKAYSTMELEEDFQVNNFRVRNAESRILRLSARVEVVPDDRQILMDKLRYPREIDEKKMGEMFPAELYFSLR